MKVLVLRTGDAAAPVAARRGEFFSWIRREAEPVWSGAWAEHDERLPDQRRAAARVFAAVDPSAEANLQAYAGLLARLCHDAPRLTEVR